MAFNKKTFTEGFIAETTENLNRVNDCLIEFKASPADREKLAKILRLLHTIKGTARMIGFSTIEKVTHGLEDVFKGIREEKYKLTDNIVQLTFKTTDIIKSLMSQLEESGSDDADVEKILAIYEKASAGMFFSLQELNDGQENKSFNDSTEEPESLDAIKSIRIPIEKINEIIHSFDSIIIRQFLFKKEIEQLGITGQMREDLARIQDSIFTVQKQIIDLRMLPLDIILTPLKRELEQESISTQKKTRFDIPPTSFMLDKVILEKLRDILLHIVRNSLDHGIEPPETRLKLGKNETGTISVTAEQISNHIVIKVSDDGKGIQYDLVRKKAAEMYPAQKDDIAKASDEELQQYLFMSGFSTNETTSMLSGRGVGLDVVRDSMEKIKGKIHLYSKEGEGTTFVLTIPLTLATQEGLFVRSNGMKFMIPSNYIVELTDNDSVPVTKIQEQTYIQYGNRLVPVYHLSSILENKVAEEAQKHDESTLSILVVEYLETQLGIGIDSIEQYENLIVSPLPPLLQGMTALQGLVFDDDYSIVPILHIPTIMEKLKKLVSYDMKKYNTLHEKKILTVLVVDDSPITRQIEKTIFESAGYKVETAADGIAALEKMQSIHIDAVVTDIYMPRMDGNMLLVNIRRLAQYNNVPVIVVSGVYDPETKEKFLNAGAQAFIVKSEFQRGNLLQAVQEFLSNSNRGDTDGTK